MNIFFLDQTGQLGGAELCLADIVKPYQNKSLVGLFMDGPFRELLQKQGTPVEVLGNRLLSVRKNSNLWQILSNLSQFIPLIAQVSKQARDYDLIYVNTQKALVVGAFASFLSHRPLVYHLHDILSKDHFSRINLKTAIALANRFASLVIANSQATKAAFIAAGGKAEKTTVIYNGFSPEVYQAQSISRDRTRQQLNFNNDEFVIGHFSRLSAWKGQHILLQALAQCPTEIKAIFVGDALFGEQDYENYLHQQVDVLGLKDRVQFLGFQSNIIPLMHACDLVAHTSTLPEPFGRVVVEAMLCGKPIVATASGGITELVKIGQTGWLFAPNDAQQLAQIILYIYKQPQEAASIAQQAQIQASQLFNINYINCQISQLLAQSFK